MRSDPRRRTGPPRARRPIPTDLARPLSANEVLRARLGVRHDRRAALIGVAIGALAVVGIAVSLASYTHDDEPLPAARAPAATVASEPPRTDRRPEAIAAPSKLELVTKVEISNTCAAPSGTAVGAPNAERASRVARDRSRVRPVTTTVPAAKPMRGRTAAPARPVDDNPY